MCAKFHANSTKFTVKGLTRKKVVNSKSTNFTRCSTYSASNEKISGKKELRKLKICMCLIKIFHYVCDKNHPNPTFLRVKALARRKKVKPKIPTFTRCSTYSSSDDKISGQRELRKLELCMYQINYFHYVCAKNHPNPTVLRVKGLARQKRGETKKHKVHEMLDLLCFRWQNLESRGA